MESMERLAGLFFEEDVAMKVQQNFWQGKKVLLTGHTGFKGTWMSLLLNNMGAIVCGYSLPLESFSFYKNIHLSVQEHHEGDIADAKKVKDVVSNFEPEIIIHLASHSSLDGSDKIPDYILQTNIMGVVNVLEAARNANSVKSIVIVTSDKCYKNMESEKLYTEECDLDGTDSYSVSKVCQELITKCYQKTFFEGSLQSRGVGVATARASNVIGIGDYNYSRLIPYVLHCFNTGEIAKLRNPDIIRSWQYVLDVDWGYLLLAKKLYEDGTGAYNGAYNFGPGVDGFRTVKDIVDILAENFPGAKYEFGKVKRSVRNETTILKLDSGKAEKVLKWKPIYCMKEIAEVISYFFINEKKKRPHSEICQEIVKNYLEKRRLFDE